MNICSDSRPWLSEALIVGHLDNDWRLKLDIRGRTLLVPSLHPRLISTNRKSYCRGGATLQGTRAKESRRRCCKFARSDLKETKTTPQIHSFFFPHTRIHNTPMFVHLHKTKHTYTIKETKNIIFVLSYIYLFVSYYSLYIFRCCRLVSSDLYPFCVLYIYIIFVFGCVL